MSRIASARKLSDILMSRVGYLASRHASWANYPANERNLINSGVALATAINAGHVGQLTENGWVALTGACQLVGDLFDHHNAVPANPRTAERPLTAEVENNEVGPIMCVGTDGTRYVLVHEADGAPVSKGDRVADNDGGQVEILRAAFRFGGPRVEVRDLGPDAGGLVTFMSRDAVVMDGLPLSWVETPADQASVEYITFNDDEGTLNVLVDGDGISVVAGATLTDIDGDTFRVTGVDASGHHPMLLGDWITLDGHENPVNGDTGENGKGCAEHLDTFPAYGFITENI